MATEISQKPLTRRERSIAAKYRKLVKAQEKASAQYELADRIGLELAKQVGGHDKTARISSDGKGLQVIDNYRAAVDHPKRAPDQMPKAWAHGCVRQFDFKEVKVFSN